MLQRFRLIIIASFIVFNLFANQPSTRIYIHNNWTLNEKDSTLTMPGTVPGCVHFDLMNANIIPDPFYRDNELKVQWIENRDWIYKTTFNADATTLNNPHIDLVFDGLDTYATVVLNGDTILISDNMYKQWRREVKKLLKQGENTLAVHFQSPINKRIPKRDTLQYPLPSVNDQGAKTCPLSRKAPYHYGWDWGPRLVTSGIWRPVYLETYQQARITATQIKLDSLSQSKAFLSANIEIEAFQDIATDAQIVASIDGKKFKATRKLNVQKGVSTHLVKFVIENPKLWYPIGYGEHPLYNIATTIANDGKTISTDQKSYGIRTVELVRENDSVGESFYFKVNGIPVFAKGANLIPFDNMLNRVTPKVYDKYIADVVKSNMNMLRVWGGGIYEEDYFYEQCDKHGILVWQDFMFSNNMFRVDDEFYNSVKDEVIYNVKRLRHHPSIVLWCGDNEGEWMWKRGWDKKFDPRVWSDYQRITYQMLPNITAELDGTRPYWRSSPSSNHDSIPPNSPNYGDMHDWSVHFGPPPYEKYTYITPRFVSEFGHQSFPDWKTVLAFTNESDRITTFKDKQYMTAEVLSIHNKQGWGNEKILRYMEYYYHVPTDFKEYVYTSQLSHAFGMQIAIEHYRRSRPITMGALFWQLNDCWPVTSWASIDYYGRWKALQYFATKFYAPLLISPNIKNDTLNVFVINDSVKAGKYQMVVDVIDFDGQKYFTSTTDIVANPLTSELKLSLPMDNINGVKDTNQLIINCKLLKNGALVSSNHIFTAYPKSQTLAKQQITTTFKEQPNGVEITLSSDKLIRNVWLSTNQIEGFFSDNYFDILPNQSVKIIWSTDDTKSIKAFKNSLEMMSLNHLTPYQK